MDLIGALHAFVRVTETGSFSAVARESNASQSAVTRQIAQLEQHFSVRLFHRTTRRLRQESWSSSVFSSYPGPSPWRVHQAPSSGGLGQNDFPVCDGVEIDLLPR